MDDKLKKLLPWIPLAIAAGYFVFLIGTYMQFIKNQRSIRAEFDAALEDWQRRRDAPADES